MREIYSAADQVIIFLGEDSSYGAGKSLRRDPGPCVRFTGHDSDEDLIKQHVRKWASSRTTKHISAPDIFCLIAILSRQIHSPKFSQDIPVHHLGAVFEALRTMLTARWWDRIWVVQEAVVAEHMVVRYGNASMPWKMLASVAIHYHDGVLSKFLDSVSPDDTKVLRLLSRVRDLDHFRQTWRAHIQGLDLLELLRQFSNRNSSDSRDKIFALMGLCDQSQNLIPNYSWDEVTVYVKYLIQMIQQKRSLSPLNGDIGRKSRRDIPSWVPDWNATFDDSDRGRLALADLYDACGGVASTIWVVNDARRIGSCIYGGGWDYDKAISQIQEDMVRLIESLESESQPEAYLPEEVESLLRRCAHSFKRIDGDGSKLQAICNKLISFCHPEGQRHPTRFINHSLLTVDCESRNGCANGSLQVRGQFIGTVSNVFEPLYSCNDTKAVLNQTKYWFVNWLRFSLGRNFNPSNIFRDFNPLNYSPIFAETLLSSAKITENGLQRLEIQDKTRLGSWLWRVLWREDPARQSYYIQRLCLKEGYDLPLHIPSLDTENLDPRVAESYSAAMRLSITKRAFFIASNGRIGLGPISMKRSDKIYVLPGGKLPFILRELPGHNEGRGRLTDSAFSLVGECYFHGCMDGEMGLPNEGGIPDDYHFFQHRPWQASDVPAESEPYIHSISII